KAQRGLPRLKKLFEHWLRWMNDPALPGGCIFMAADTELDDKEGRPRDHVAAGQRQLHEVIARVARGGIEESELRENLDCHQLAFEVHAIMFAFNHDKRLLRESKPEARARAAFERLLDSATTK